MLVVTTRCVGDVTAKAAGVRLSIENQYPIHILYQRNSDLPSIFTTQRNRSNSGVYTGAKVGQSQSSIIESNANTNANKAEKGNQKPEKRIVRAEE